jgi:hypothetical protein
MQIARAVQDRVEAFAAIQLADGGQRPQPDEPFRVARQRRNERGGTPVRRTSQHASHLRAHLAVGIEHEWLHQFECGGFRQLRQGAGAQHANVWHVGAEQQ